MYTGFTESRAEYRAWIETITHTHQRRITVRVLDLNHARKAWIDNVLDGQVTIDVENRDVGRVANLRLVDPTRSIGWEPHSPASLPLHLRRMVQIWDNRLIPERIADIHGITAGWVGCSVFCGPVAEMDREGAEVSIVAEGKDRLALRSFGRTHHWEKKRKKVDVIREMLMLSGEVGARIHLPALRATLGKDLNVSITDKPLVQARKLAASENHVLIADGRGHWVMRKRPSIPSLVLDRDWLRAPVNIDRPKIEFHNGWIIDGPKPSGDKPRITSGLVPLPEANAFSAQKLARNGKLGWEIYRDERSQVKTKAKALEIAHRMRDERINAAAEVSVDCLPFPNAEEYDLYRVRDPLTGVSLTRLRQATIPLVGGDMSIGAIRQVSRVKRASHGGL